MKKISLLAIGLVASLSLSAQPEALKNVEKMVKSKDYTGALEAVQPFLTNPETAETSLPWYLAGKAALGIWDQVNIESVTPGNNVDDNKKADAAKQLVKAYEYYNKALPLDQKPDAKGKVKAKYTKEMRKALGENYKSYMQAGLNLYNTQNYPAAYEAWDIYVNLPANANVDEKAFVADADSVVGEIAYYQALAAYFSKDYKNAIAAANNALQKGYQNKNVYIVGMESAGELKDNAAQLALAEQGNAKYGGEDISFLASLVNNALESKDYAKANNLVSSTIESAKTDSLKSLLYNVKGIVEEQQNNIAAAKASLAESIKLNPKNAKSYFDMGRLIQNEVATKEIDADDATRMNVLVPAIKEAISMYEKSYELDPDQTRLPGYIYRLYYNLDQNYHLGQEYADKAEYWKNI